MRTSRGRRYRDIVDTVIMEFEAADDTQIRELAGLRFTLEELQAHIVQGKRGHVKAHGDLVRIANLIARREKEMRLETRAAPVLGPTIDEFLSRHEPDDDPLERHG